jgi:uncharacterized protein involved in exopolysaccharide biosynthesis
VTTKILEAFFRHKLLLLLPPFLIPLIVGPIALMSAPIYYESWAGVWVDRPQYLAYTQAGWNTYLTPAQNQANALNEQLKTRSFVMDIAKRTQLAPLVGNARGEDRILKVFTDGLAITPNGDHLLVLRFRADTPKLAYDLLNSTIDAFKENASTDRVNQASLAISFYQAQLNDGQDNLNKLTSSARQYIAANPRLGSLTSQPGQSTAPVLPATATDPQLADLMGQIQFQQKEIDRIRGELSQAQFDASAGLEGQELGFQVIDPAQVPASPTRALKKQLIMPIGGLVGGAVLSIVLLVFLVTADRAVRGESDLPTNVRVLGDMPVLKLKLRRIPKAARRDAMRRAIGFAAGAALPAPGGSK